MQEALENATTADSTRRTISPKKFTTNSKFFLKVRQQKCKIIGAYDNVSRMVASARGASERTTKQIPPLAEL